MINIKVSLDHKPPQAVIEHLPEGGAWLRIYNNAVRHVDYTYVDAQDGAGGAQAMVSWIADEISMKLTREQAAGLTVEAVLADLEAWLTRAETWEPAVQLPKPTLESLQADMKTMQPVAALIAEIGISKTVQQSDKLGSDWITYKLGDVILRRDYVAQENPRGTADNPIAWNDDVTVIPNAYYVHDGVRKVWMGEARDCAAWDDAAWVVF